jgi:hypothetical protein
MMQVLSQFQFREDSILQSVKAKLISLVHVEVSLQDSLLEMVWLLGGSGLRRHLADRRFHGGDTLRAGVVLST